MYTVYAHINKANGKIYIGITMQPPEIRWKRGKGYSNKLPIGRAFEKYGWDNFIHGILYEGLDEKEAKSIEKYLISSWKTQQPEYGYNICGGGDGVCGWHPSEDTKKKISIAASKRIGDKNSNYNNKWTDKMKETASVAHRKENLSDETIAKMSKSAKDRFKKYGGTFTGKSHSDETKAKLAMAHRHAVDMFDLDGNYIKTFISIKDAAKYINGSEVGISNCCRGITMTSGKYKWQYSK